MQQTDCAQQTFISNQPHDSPAVGEQQTSNFEDLLFDMIAENECSRAVSNTVDVESNSRRAHTTEVYTSSDISDEDTSNDANQLDRNNQNSVDGNSADLGGPGSIFCAGVLKNCSSLSDAPTEFQIVNAQSVDNKTDILKSKKKHKKDRKSEKWTPDCAKSECHKRTQKEKVFTDNRNHYALLRKVHRTMNVHGAVCGKMSKQSTADAVKCCSELKSGSTENCTLPTSKHVTLSEDCTKSKESLSIPCKKKKHGYCIQGKVTTHAAEIQKMTFVDSSTSLATCTGLPEFSYSVKQNIVCPEHVPSGVNVHVDSTGSEKERDNCEKHPITKAANQRIVKSGQCTESRSTESTSRKTKSNNKMIREHTSLSVCSSISDVAMSSSVRHDCVDIQNTVVAETSAQTAGVVLHDSVNSSEDILLDKDLPVACSTVSSEDKSVHEASDEDQFEQLLLDVLTADKSPAFAHCENDDSEDLAVSRSEPQHECALCESTTDDDSDEPDTCPVAKQSPSQLTSSHTDTPGCKLTLYTDELKDNEIESSKNESQSTKSQDCSTCNSGGSPSLLNSTLLQWFLHNDQTPDCLRDVNDINTSAPRPNDDTADGVVEPDDDDTEQNNTFDDKTSNVISSDDIPVADVDQTASTHIINDWKLKTFPTVRMETMNETFIANVRKVHNVNVDTTAGRCTCSQVKIEVDDESSLTVNERTQHQQKKHVCTVCGKQFKTNRSLNEHSERHIGDLKYSCSKCEKLFVTRSDLRHHMNIHAGKYKCTECGRCCRDSVDLAVHMRSHLGEKAFQCAVCNKQFPRLGDLDIHSRIHIGEKSYKCHMCDKVFSQSGNLNNHMRVHTGDKPYKCHTCDKVFSQSAHLNNHMRVHTEDKPYKCSLCDKSFSQPSSVHRHTQSVHSNIRTWDCSYCGKMFKTKRHLKQHVHAHTGTKPHSCRHCSKRFTYGNQLKRHLLESHNEGTWFTCHICQKKFSRSEHLKIHIRRHEGVKPYVCSKCPMRFCTGYELKYHRCLN